MVQAFEQAEAPFSHRLLAALEAGLGEGGEAGPLHSAGLLIVRSDISWPIVDLRVDWIDNDPIASLLARGKSLGLRWKITFAAQATRKRAQLWRTGRSLVHCTEITWTLTGAVRHLGVRCATRLPTMDGHYEVHIAPPPVFHRRR